MVDNLRTNRCVYSMPKEPLLHTESLSHNFHLRINSHPHLCAYEHILTPPPVIPSIYIRAHGTTTGTHTEAQVLDAICRSCPPTPRDKQHQTSDTCVDLCQPPTSARSAFSSLTLLTLRWGVPHARFSTPVHHRGEGTWHGVGAQQTTTEQGEVTPFLLPPADRGHMLCVNDSVGARVALGNASPATRTRSFVVGRCAR